MKLIFENWKKFVEEGIEGGRHNLKYYAFDWDDNLLEMPTKIVLLDDSGNEVGMDTAAFADFRSQIGKEEFEYEGHKIKNFAPEPFRNFRVSGDKQFLKDVMLAETAPSWNDFLECVNSASIFAIITARGHRPLTLKRATYKLIMNNIHGIDSEAVFENVKKYRRISKKVITTDKAVAIKEYLDLCRFYPVSFEAGSMASPEQLKVEKLREFVNYCEKLNRHMPIKVGFSDDDRKNIDLIERHFSNEIKLKLLTVKYTGKQHGEE